MHRAERRLRRRRAALRLRQLEHTTRARSGTPIIIVAVQVIASIAVTLVSLVQLRVCLLSVVNAETANACRQSRSAHSTTPIRPWHSDHFQSKPRASAR
jgi:hypothetical protein